jgi:Spy/CpxP family protein refolding chaperone
MKTFIIAILILAGLLAIGGFAYAKKQGVCDGPEGRANWMVERISKKLDLDESQRDRLEQLRDRLLSMRERFAEARAQGREAVAELLSSPTLDQDRAQALVEQKTSFVSANSAELIAAFADFSDSLNDEQRGTLLEWLDHRGGHGFGHRHWRM